MDEGGGGNGIGIDKGNGGKSGSNVDGIGEGSGDRVGNKDLGPMDRGTHSVVGMEGGLEGEGSGEETELGKLGTGGGGGTLLTGKSSDTELERI